MSATATAKPISRKSVVAGYADFTNGGLNASIVRTQAAYPEELTPEERARLWAKSKDYDDFTDKAIAFGKLTGDFTIDRHIWPQPSRAEIRARIERVIAENPELYTQPSRNVRGVE